MSIISGYFTNISSVMILYENKEKIIIKKLIIMLKNDN